MLCHAFPGADMPVVQPAVNAMTPFEYHLDLGAELAPVPGGTGTTATSGPAVPDPAVVPADHTNM